jgi:hypothetical protein
MGLMKVQIYLDQQSNYKLLKKLMGLKQSVFTLRDTIRTKYVNMLKGSDNGV